MAIVNNFIPMGGKHCITNALRQVFNFYGYRISEEMLFGIGAGLGFTYINLSSAPMISGRTKPFEFEERIADRFNIEIKCKKSKQSSIVFQKTKSLLDNNKPLLVYADMPYLEYLNLSEDSHFGGHAIVIYGYDDEKGCFYVSDRDNDDYPIRTPKGYIARDFHLVDYTKMERARSSNHRPFPANNKYLEFDFKNYEPITSEKIIEAIHETCNTMLNPPANLLGVNGIHKFSKEVLKWSKFGIGKRKLAGVTNYFMISADGGTGSGVFRSMYGEFLIEAGRILDNSDVEILGNRYISVSQQWEQIAKLLWDLSITGDNNVLKSISYILSEICTCETQILEELIKTTV